MQLNVHSVAYPVTALGPGQRFVLWVAGCPLRCHGCISPELWMTDSGQALEVDDLVQHILQCPAPISGLTLSGGEPFAQAEPLVAVLDHIKRQRPIWNVLAFSGYPLVWLQKQMVMRNLLQFIDVLVAGPYAYRQTANNLGLRASRNQQIHYLSATGLTLKPQINQLTYNSLANLGLSQQQPDRLIGIFAPAQRQSLHQQLQYPSKP